MRMLGDKTFKEINDMIKACTSDSLTFHNMGQAKFDHVIHRLMLCSLCHTLK